MTTTITRHSVVTRVSNAVAAGTSDVNSTSVDNSLYGAVAFIVEFGAITSTAVTSVKLQGSVDNSTFYDLENTSITVADTDDNEIFIAEVVDCPYRYVRCVVDRGTANAVIDSILAIQTNPKFLPVTQPTGTNVEVNYAPNAGTA